MALEGKLMMAKRLTFLNKPYDIVGLRKSLAEVGVPLKK
jgi:hypothetical protein